MAVEEHERFDPAELDAGHETLTRRLEALHGGLRTVERTLRPSGLVVDLVTAEGPPSTAPAPPTVIVPVVVDAAARERPTSSDTFSHVGTSRPSLLQSFRAWWQAERMARENERRARAAAEAAAKVQELQSHQPPSSAEHVQAIRGVMALTEERFQTLGIRSERLHDELVGISRAIAELRDAASAHPGGPIRIPSAEAANDLADDLQERLDTLLLALAEEFRRRSEEIERSLSAQMAIQNAELAMLLEDALIRMRSLIPEEMSKVAAEVSATVERAVASLPPPVGVFGPAPRADA